MLDTAPFLADVLCFIAKNERPSPAPQQPSEREYRGGA